MQAVELALIAAQKLPGKCIHGDLRANNIFARWRQNKWEINFLDFATAGYEGVVRYAFRPCYKLYVH